MKRVVVNPINGSYDKVKESMEFENRMSEGYSAALILSDRRQDREFPIIPEPMKPWTPVIRVSENVVRRRIL